MTARLDPAVKAQRAVERQGKSFIRIDGAFAYIELLNGGVATIDADAAIKQYGQFARAQ